MKKATRKQEIDILHSIIALARCEQVYNVPITMLDALEEKLGITFTRIKEWRGGATEMPLWRWEQLLSNLELGWKRYISGCSHEDSIFCRIYCYLTALIPCTCCLWWRTVAIATTLTIASFFLGKYLS